VRLRVCLAFLLLLTAMPAVAADDPPTQWSLAVLTDRADGMTLVNGVPIHGFTKAGASEKNTSTVNLPLAPWLVNGRNVIEVRLTKLAPGGELGARVIKSERDMAEGQFERLLAPHTITFQLETQGLPRWRFLDAEPLGNDQPALLKAVAALHAAAARADGKALVAMRKPYLDDMSQLFGPPPAGYEDELTDELKQARLAPLSDRLRISTAHDGRLAIVENPDGRAPVRAEIAGGRMEIGFYWAKLDGQWLLVR
jgi:hypothetical protein